MQTRREILVKSVLGLGAGIVAGRSAPALAEMCIGTTPAQTEGPFYPVAEQLDADNDLTYVKSKSEPAKGDIIYIRGVISDQNCQPVKGAVVEIWQACQSGKYNHPSDPNPAPLDPNFQYFGRSIANEQGIYFFKTIRPGSYPAAANWIRPSHIHVKVYYLGYEELTTQLYFSDDPYNPTDYILNNIPKTEQSRVIVDFTKDTLAGSPLGVFDISLKKIIT